MTFREVSLVPATCELPARIHAHWGCNRASTRHHNLVWAARKKRGWRRQPLILDENEKVRIFLEFAVSSQLISFFHSLISLPS